MRNRRVALVLLAMALLPLAQIASTVGAPPAHGVQPALGTPFVVDPAVNNTVANFATTDTRGGSEPSVALNPANPQQAVMTAFSGGWGANAPLWLTNNGGQTWTKTFSIPAPPGRPSAINCPCDQTVDFGRNGTLYGTFLINPTTGTANGDIVSGSTTNPAQAASWSWFTTGNPPVTQLTANTGVGNVDQPWLLVNRDATTAANDDTFVAYQDLANNNNRVAVSRNAAPPNFTVDQNAGSRAPNDSSNSGLRLASDSTNGREYAVWQTATAGPNGAGNSPHNVTLHLNRTTDSGANWTLNGNTGGITLAVGNQDEFDFSFGQANTLQGGIDHATVDPATGDVYVVFGRDDDGVGANNNTIYIDRLTYDNAGNLNLVAGYPRQVNASVDAALPSVAVTSDGVIGVLYDTFDGTTPAPGSFPKFSAHLARSTDQGQTFTDTVLSSFQSPTTGTGVAGRRDLGDFQQLKAQGSQLYGVFSGNRQAFSATANNVIDPVYFSVPGPNADLQTTKTGPATALPGSSASYSISVKNNGTFDAVNATMTDALPTGTTFVSITPPGGWTCPTQPPVGTNGTVICTTPTLNTGSTATFTLVLHFNATIASGTNITNTATAASLTPDLNSGNNSGSATTQVVCANTLTGRQPTGVALNGGSWCVSNANFGSTLTIGPGTTVIMVNSTVGSDTVATNPGAISLCGDTLRGQLKITGATGFVLVGDTGDDGCVGNTLSSVVTLSNNTAGTELANNPRIGNQVTLSNNSGTGPFPDDNRPEIESNTMFGGLACTGNVPPASNDGHPNSVAGTRSGECGTPGF